MASRTDRSRGVERRPGVFEIWKQLRLAWRLFWDGRVDPFIKIIPLMGLAYLIMPIDLIPDILVPVGEVDDIGIILAALQLFIQFAPGTVVREHLRSMTGSGLADEDVEGDDVIEGEYHVEE